jgi:hypothetical protein
VPQKESFKKGPTLTVVLAVVLALALTPASCGSPAGSDTTPCVSGLFGGGGSGGSSGSGVSLTVVVGAEDAARTRVATIWQDGMHVPLVAGGQGGFMIRPALDVTAPAPLPETGAHAACLGVRMTAAAPASAPPVALDALAPRVPGTTATYHVGALFGLLSNSGGVDGMAVPVTFDVHVSAGDGQTQLTVVPDATLSP